MYICIYIYNSFLLVDDATTAGSDAVSGAREMRDPYICPPEYVYIFIYIFHVFRCGCDGEVVFFDGGGGWGVALLFVVSFPPCLLALLTRV